MSALRRNDAFVLGGNGAVASFGLIIQIALDIAFTFLGALGKRGELRVIGVPALGDEQLFRGGQLPVADGLANVGNDAGHLVLSTKFGSARALTLRKDGREQAVEREKYRRDHASEKHHPEHGILEDDARRLEVGLDQLPLESHDEKEDAGAGRDVEQCARVVGQSGWRDEGDGDQRGGQNETAEHASERLRLTSKTGLPGYGLAHAGGKTFPDQPGDDQHHALNAEGDEQRQRRLTGKVTHAVPGRVARRQRQRDAGGPEQRQPPIAEHGFPHVGADGAPGLGVKNKRGQDGRKSDDSCRIG